MSGLSIASFTLAQYLLLSKQARRVAALLCGAIRPTRRTGFSRAGLLQSAVGSPPLCRKRGWIDFSGLVSRSERDQELRINKGILSNHKASGHQCMPWCARRVLQCSRAANSLESRRTSESLRSYERCDSTTSDVSRSTNIDRNAESPQCRLARRPNHAGYCPRDEQLACFKLWTIHSRGRRRPPTWKKSFVPIVCLRSWTISMLVSRILTLAIVEHASPRQQDTCASASTDTTSIQARSCSPFMASSAPPCMKLEHLLDASSPLTQLQQALSSTPQDLDRTPRSLNDPVLQKLASHKPQPRVSITENRLSSRSKADACKDPGG